MTNGAVTDTHPVDAGGVAYLASHLRPCQARARDSLTVAAGDIVGASPLLSAAFHDEPTIEAMNTLGLDVTSVGNHEFDEGYKELQRLDNGWLHRRRQRAPTTRTPAPAARSSGADYDILAANVFYTGTNKTILPPTRSRTSTAPRSRSSA